MVAAVLAPKDQFRAARPLTRAPWRFICSFLWLASRPVSALQRAEITRSNDPGLSNQKARTRLCSFEIIISAGSSPQRQDLDFRSVPLTRTWPSMSSANYRVPEQLYTGVNSGRLRSGRTKGSLPPLAREIRPDPSMTKARMEETE
jgi:hypothetical protein